MNRYFKILIFTIFFVACNEKEQTLFQDDFEDDTVGHLPDAPWRKSGEGIVIVDNSRSFSGDKSVHFTSGQDYQNRAFIGIDHIFPLPLNKYYGSLKMYVEEASPDGIHWTMLQSSGKVKGTNYSSEIRYGGQHNKQLMANYETQGVKSDCWKHADIKIPEKQWFTLQWYFDGNQDTMKFWLNEKFIETLMVVQKGEGCMSNDTNGTWRFPVFENLLIGWVDYQTGGGTRNVWIDDVLISKERI